MRNNCRQKSNRNGGNESLWLWVFSDCSQRHILERHARRRPRVGFSFFHLLLCLGLSLQGRAAGASVSSKLLAAVNNVWSALNKGCTCFT